MITADLSHPAQEDEDAFLTMQKEYWEIKKEQRTGDERHKQ